jgi:hypothetical protein
MAIHTITPKCAAEIASTVQRVLLAEKCKEVASATDQHQVYNNIQAAFQKAQSPDEKKERKQQWGAKIEKKKDSHLALQDPRETTNPQTL